MAYFFFFNDTATTEIYTLSLHDALPISTARQARQRGLHCLASAAARELEVDCGGVTASDSAGLAVLLDWLGAMKRAGRALRYTRLPQGLVALGRISEVEGLLERGV